MQGPRRREHRLSSSATPSIDCPSCTPEPRAIVKHYCEAMASATVFPVTKSPNPCPRKKPALAANHAADDPGSFTGSKDAATKHEMYDYRCRASSTIEGATAMDMRPAARKRLTIPGKHNVSILRHSSNSPRLVQLPGAKSRNEVPRFLQPCLATPPTGILATEKRYRRHSALPTPRSSAI